jgi:hypothetical protein
MAAAARRNQRNSRRLIPSLILLPSSQSGPIPNRRRGRFGDPSGSRIRQESSSKLTIQYYVCCFERSLFDHEKLEVYRVELGFIAIAVFWMTSRRRDTDVGDLADFQGAERRTH